MDIHKYLLMNNKFVSRLKRQSYLGANWKESSRAANSIYMVEFKDLDRKEGVKVAGGLCLQSFRNLGSLKGDTFDIR